MVWDSTTEQYVDSGVVARGMPASFSASATTLSPGSAATASITGTAENPVLNLGIPRGADSPVQTVCGVSADGTGNVPVQDSNIPCSEISGQTTVEGAIASLNSQIGNVVLKGSKHTLSAGGTLSNTITLQGLTANHVVANWGLSVGTVGDPPADITITEAANAYTVAVSNVREAFEFTPTFVLPQNLA